MGGQGGRLDLIHSVLLTPVLYKGQCRWYLLKSSVHHIFFCNNAVPHSPSRALSRRIFSVLVISSRGLEILTVYSSFAHDFV